MNNDPRTVPEFSQMVSFDDLRRLAASNNVNLLHAYLRAGCADSTYYRHAHGSGMTIDTYNAVSQAIRDLCREVAA